MMIYADFPQTHEKVSVLGLGTWVFGGENWGGADDDACLAAVDEALALGVNFIDTAPFYSDGKAERLIGKAIKDKRDKVFLATKCGLIRENGRVRHDLSRNSIFKEVDLSRERLGVDVIDLYMCHWPDPSVALEESMAALLELKQKGVICHIGVSNFDLDLLKRAVTLAPVAALQVQYSILNREIENELLPFCRENNIGVIAYGVLGGGILTGKYKNPPTFKKSDARRMFYPFYEEGNFKKAQVLIKELQSVGRPLNQAAINWVRQKSGVMTTLVGCRNCLQLKENLSALDWNLS